MHTSLIANYNGSKKENASKEFDHPQYDKFTVEPVNEIGAIQENKLYAFKYVTWVKTDKKCVNRLLSLIRYSVKPDGTLNNVYNLYAEWIDDQASFRPEQKTNTTIMVQSQIGVGTI